MRDERLSECATSLAWKATSGADVKKITASAFALFILAGCGGTQDSGPTTVPTLPAPAPEPAPAPAPDSGPVDPDPVQLVALLNVGELGVAISGITNLPDGAVLEFDVFLSGSGCLTDDCREFEELSEEQSELLFDGSGRGYVTVSGGKFYVELPGWEILPVCGWGSKADWDTEATVLFIPDEGLSERIEGMPRQPDEIYRLYGSAGERLEAVAPAEVVTLLNPAVRSVAECVTD